MCGTSPLFALCVARCAELGEVSLGAHATQRAVTAAAGFPGTHLGIVVLAFASFCFSDGGAPSILKSSRKPKEDDLGDGEARTLPEGEARYSVTRRGKLGRLISRSIQLSSQSDAFYKVIIIFIP